MSLIHVKYRYCFWCSMSLEGMCSALSSGASLGGAPKDAATGQ